MENLEEKSVGQIVAEDYRAAEVFENHKIDFCCHGNRNFGEVAQKKNMDVQTLIDEINKVTQGKAEDQNDFESWPLDQLSDFIVKTYHRHAEEQIQVLRPYLEKICQVHGDHHPELFEVKDIFMEVSGDIAKHQKKEELMLFPFIKKMAHAQGNKDVLKALPSKAIEDRVKMLTDEHDSQGEAFNKMAELSHDFMIPEDACMAYKVSLQGLKDFQENLHKHIHLENNILFPKAMKLIEQLTA
jgi:regulator of cell morphogenesis and NO signaling